MILQIPIQGYIGTFILVSEHRALDIQEEEQTPYFHYPLFMTRAVDAILSDKVHVIEPKHIITHLTTYTRPSGTYGINRDILEVCWALNRGRK